MRVNVTAGYVAPLRILIEDDLKKDLSAASFKIGLIPTAVDPGPTDPLWRSPTRVSFPKVGLALVELVIDSSMTLGTWHGAALLDDGAGPELYRVARQTIELV